MRKKLSILLCAFGVLVLCLYACNPAESSVGKENDASLNNNSDGTAVTWTVDADCSPCHELESHTFTDNMTLAGFHAAQSNAECITCHADELALETVHEGANGPSKAKRLKQTEVTDGTCLSCHGSYEKLAVKTTGSTVLTDSEGKTVNPHDLPAGEGHSKITCASCHDGHSENNTETYQKYCLSCHHADVYECDTCHE